MTLYNPPHFRSDDEDALVAALATMPFATLVSNGADGPVVSHLPLVVMREAGQPLRLIGHLARANAHWREADLARETVAIFSGADAYVSPGWYPSKQEHGRVVPTWNYSVIHAAGRLAIHDDKDWLRSAVTRLTERHEAGRGAPWAVTDAPETFLDGQIKGIIGIELVVARLEGKFKLSQNRSAEDRTGVIEGLGQEPDPASAAVRGQMIARRQT